MKRSLELLSLVTLLISILFIFSYCKKNSKQLDKIRIGIPLQPSNAIMICAWKKGFLKSEGLDAEIKTYPSGKRCLQNGLLKNNVDIGSTGDIPFAVNYSKNDNIRIICALCTAGSIQEIIARKDQGILRPKDLKGKKIGTQKGSVVHYFLDRFLILNNISPEEVNILYFKAEDLPSALADGKIDAFSMREPYISKAKKLLGKENVVIFNENDANINYDILVADKDFLDKNSRLINKLMKALFRAEHFLKNNKPEAQRIVSVCLKAPIDDIKQVWDKSSFNLSLSQSMLNSFDEYRKWINKTGLLNRKLPYVDFRTKVDFAPLDKIDNSQNTIIR